MSLSRTSLYIGLVAFFAFAGGFTAQALLGASANAAEGNGGIHFLRITGDQGRKGIDAYVNDGQPGEVFYGEDGQMRLQLGTYNAAGERGLPLVGLSDNKGQLRMLLRLAGGAESPVIIMKDDAGRDRLVMGLSFDKGQEPFLSITDASGTSKDIFGNYSGHP